MAFEASSDPDGPAFEAQVVSAFGEAFNNIAVHAYRNGEPGPVHVEVDWDDAKLVITLIDLGETFDPATVKAPNLDDLPESGMGLYIMHSCMDEVDYRAGPPNVLRMVKLRKISGSSVTHPGPAGRDCAAVSVGSTLLMRSERNDWQVKMATSSGQK